MEENQERNSQIKMEEVKVLGSWFSAFDARVRIALKLKGVKYEHHEEDLEAKSELLLKSNPVYKKIPVLIHNGKPISESMIIVQYIDEVWAGGRAAILPSDPYDRAIASFWAVYIDDKLYTALKGVGLSQTEEAKSEAKSQVFHGLQLLEEAFINCSKGKGFFGGESMGYLDLALGSLLGYFKANEKILGVKFLDKRKTPLIVGWAERFCADAIVKEVMPETDKLVELITMYQTMLKNVPSV